MRTMRRDELDEAYEKGCITTEQYERTLSEGAKLKALLEEHRDIIVTDIENEYLRLKNKRC